MRLWTSLIVGCAMLLPACRSATGPVASTASPPMQHFADDAQLRTFLANRAAYQAKHPAAYGENADMVQAPGFDGPMPPPPAAAPANESPMQRAEPGITNTQEADVDEGGIVKVHGRHLVVLRRGRLFTVEIGDQAMRAIDRIDVFPPRVQARDDWYDEMLVSGDRVIVIGYSYARGGTEINRFRIDAAGRLAFEDSHHLRSNDYYSSSNYASRLIGTRLVFYTPLMMQRGAEALAGMPGLRRWTGRADAPFEGIAAATRIFLPAPVRADPSASTDVLHTVTSCDLAAANLVCSATAVLGAWSSEFYVSGNAVYVWIASAFRGQDRQPHAMVYRLPLDGSAPGAAQAQGGPVDQFSFREERAEGALNVLVRPDTGGGRMWQSEASEGAPALLHLPLALFGDGSRAAPTSAYRALPIEAGPNWSFHNRFVGRHLVYAAGELAGDAPAKTLFAVPLDGGPVAKVAVPHGIDRIEVMGADAVVVGNDARQRLGFTAVRLRPDGAFGESSYFLPAASEGERRSQAFFYRPDPGSADGTSGTLGLPVTRKLGDSRLARFLGSGSAIAFLRRDNRLLRPAGTLDAHAADARDDGCRVSCTDWYGNARPIFLGDRIFALMGYELVEGRLADGKIAEVGRLDYGASPRRPPAD